mmetsp:Transcript_28847/g.51795  ORF Transcript_28847/g.51795 Transcript_28847/m.51795 type:complete len:125 (-) Transcript_28847:261-635(-)
MYMGCPYFEVGESIFGVDFTQFHGFRTVTSSDYTPVVPVPLTCQPFTWRTHDVQCNPIDPVSMSQSFTLPWISVTPGVATAQHPTTVFDSLKATAACARVCFGSWKPTGTNTARSTRKCVQGTP